MLVTSNHL